jgi:glycosyltransferase involved in cell wall biosynthesis
MKRVAILHYAAPPTVGGVEQTIYYHALELTKAGYAVRVLAGVGEPFDPRVEVRIVPEFGSRQREVLAVKRQLDRGQVTADFAALRDRLVELLSDALAGADALIAHNVFTLHKNLPLTAALYELVSGQDYPTTRLLDHLTILAWHHDLAWDDPRYLGDVHTGQPWDLLRTSWPRVQHVTVSAAQRARLASLYGISPERISIVSPGVDAARFFRWTESTRRLVEVLKLLEADLLLLLPARLTRRKNVEMALRILAALRASSGRDARLIVTGPPGAHNPANAAYLQHLLDLRLELGLQDAAHFLYELELCPDDDTMADLYQLADGMLFPSAKEGFGIPILEAGLARLPVFCSDIPPLRESGQEQVHTFSLDARAEDVARLVWDKLNAERATILRRRVLAESLWSSIARHKLIPLLEGGSEG